MMIYMENFFYMYDNLNMCGTVVNALFDSCDVVFKFSFSFQDVNLYFCLYVLVLVLYDLL